MTIWQKKAIKLLGRVVTGKTPPKEIAEYWDGAELFVSPKDMTRDSTFIQQTQSKISKRALNKFKGQILPKNSVMYTALSYGFGKIGIAKQQLITNQQINSIIVYKDHDFRFVYYLLRVSTPYIFSFNSGIDTPIVPKSVFEKIELLVPSFNIQRKIAAVLSAYDDLIENNNRRIAILEKMAEELYREWFVRLRFPGHEKTKIIKGIPEDWEIKRLGDIVNAIMGQSPPSESYNQAGIGLPFNQGVGTYGQRYPQKIMYCNVAGRIVGCGSILISVRAPVGRLNIADCKMIIGRGLAGLNHKKGLNSYLFYLLRDKFSTEDLIGNGSIFNSVTKDEMLGLKILAPSQFLVEEFDKTVLPIDKSISIVLKNNNCLKMSRDKLLSRLMSGRINLENLDIQFPTSMQEEE